MEKVLDRIKKLLALAESSSPEEAQLAAQRAAELMTKHAISEAEARGHDPSRINIVEGRIDDLPGQTSRRVVNGWASLLANVLVTAHNGSLLHRQVRDENKRTKKGIHLIMFGTADSIDVVRYLFMMLEKTLLHNVRKYLRENNGRGPEGNAYLMGQVVGINTALKAGREKALSGDPGTAIVLVDKVREKATAERDKTSTKSIRGPNTNVLSANFADGMRDAENISLGTDNAPGLAAGTKHLKGGE